MAYYFLTRCNLPAIRSTIKFIKSKTKVSKEYQTPYFLCSYTVDIILAPISQSDIIIQQFFAFARNF